MHHQVRYDRVYVLLDLVPKRGDKAYQTFCKALRYADQPWLAELLEK